MGALTAACFVWRVSNSYYTKLLRIKFNIIYDVETALGIDAFQKEWKALPRGGPARWFALERSMPALFTLGYIVFLTYVLPKEELEGPFVAVRTWLTALTLPHL